MDFSSLPQYLNCVNGVSITMCVRRQTVLTWRSPVQVLHCEHGQVDLKKVFGKDSRAIVAHLNVEGQHRGAVAAVRAQQDEDEAAAAAAAAAADSHEHMHGEGHEHGGAHTHPGGSCTHEVRI